MQLFLLKSKLHRATMTGITLERRGSVTISEDFAGVVCPPGFDRILVRSTPNGVRSETSVIYGPSRAGIIGLNGATAHLDEVRDFPMLAAASK